MAYEAFEHITRVQENCVLSNGGTFRSAGSGGANGLAAVLMFMEDQWSRTSLLAKQKERLSGLQ